MDLDNSQDVMLAQQNVLASMDCFPELQKAEYKIWRALLEDRVKRDAAGADAGETF